MENKIQNETKMENTETKGFGWAKNKLQDASLAKVAFATDITLEEAREAVKDRPEFAEKKQEDFIVFNYKVRRLKIKFAVVQLQNLSQPKLGGRKKLSITSNPKAREFASNICRECRGLTFSAETKKVIARRYHKFFNINELPETDETLIDLSKPHVILQKYDGFGDEA